MKLINNMCLFTIVHNEEEFESFVFSSKSRAIKHIKRVYPEAKLQAADSSEGIEMWKNDSHTFLIETIQLLD